MTNGRWTIDFSNVTRYGKKLSDNETEVVIKEYIGLLKKDRYNMDKYQQGKRKYFIYPTKSLE